MLSTCWCACGVCSYCPFHPGSLTNCTWDVKQIVKVVDKKCHDQSLWTTVRLASPRLALMLHAEWCTWQVVHDQSHWSSGQLWLAFVHQRNMAVQALRTSVADKADA
jgi:hypothetical protein